MIEVISNKIIIGTHVMFYEIDMLPDFVESLVNAINTVSNKTNITCDFQFNISQYFEKIDTQLINKEQLTRRFFETIQPIIDTGCKVQHNIYNNDEIPLTMVDYRRDLNYIHCRSNDLIIWGETDCLLPLEAFKTLDALHEYAKDNSIHRYIATFGIRKMWDSSWETLEHPFVAGKPWHSYATEPDMAFNKPYSIRYTMKLQEMYDINSREEELDIRLIDQPKFDGSCLVISSDLIKAGANIPLGMFGLSAEDTAFMYSCQQVMGSDYRQFVIKSVLKVHNRNHPKKRMYISNSSQQFDHAHISADKGSWFDTLSELNKENLNRIFFKKGCKILSYNDYNL
jgi:hypothetical protein